MTVREKLYNEIYRQTERRLEAQLDAAVARDQRAFVITGFSVVSSGLAGRAAELLGSWLFAVAAMLAILAAVAGALSAFPREFFGAGYEFKQLSPVIEQVDGYEVFLASMAAKNDEYIVKNEQPSIVPPTSTGPPFFSFCLARLSPRAA